MSKSSTPPSGSIHAMDKPNIPEQIERVATHDGIPNRSNYYEKDGPRTYGDDEDHDREPKVRLSLKRMPVGLLIKCRCLSDA